MKLRWERRIVAPAEPVAICAATPVYTGKLLYLAANQVTIKGTSYPGSVQARVPGSGHLWETVLPNGVVGSPTMDGAGVLAVGTFDSTSTPNATYLVRASSGRFLRTLVQGMDFAQTVFANNLLFTANSNGVYAFGLRRP
jgi:hypothetical protein